MNKRVSKIIGVSSTILLVSSSLAFAQPQSKPNGPFVEKEQSLSVSGYMSNEQLYKTLEQIQKTSKGKMILEKVGMSNEYPESKGSLVDKDVDSNYPIYVAKFGNNDESKKKVLITTQIHGNEAIGTEAVIDLMKTLQSGNPEVEKILEEVSIWIMPRVNPDGSDYQYNGNTYSIRQSIQSWNPEEFGLDEHTKAPFYYNSSQKAPGIGGGPSIDVEPGFDQNRDYSPNFEFRLQEGMESLLNGETNNSSKTSQGYLVTPEARIVTSVFDEFKPDVFIDLHHKGFSLDDEGKPVSIEISTDMIKSDRVYTVGGKDYKLNDDVYKLGKQVNLAVYNELSKYKSHLGSIERYDDTVDAPGTALGTFALNGAAPVLFEIKGQTHSLGQKQSGALVKVVREGIYGLLRGLSDNSVYQLDTKLYDEIPVSYDRVSDPTVREE